MINSTNNNNKCNTKHAEEKKDSARFERICIITVALSSSFASHRLILEGSRLENGIQNRIIVDQFKWKTFPGTAAYRGRQELLFQKHVLIKTNILSSPPHLFKYKRLLFTPLWVSIHSHFGRPQISLFRLNHWFSFFWTIPI